MIADGVRAIAPYLWESMTFAEYTGGQTGGRTGTLWDEICWCEPEALGRSGRATPLLLAESYPLPFRTCIVLGHMFGEDGNKMSKRLRNYREPSYIFDTYGADAMRWYFFAAQVPWTSTRFIEASIRDAHREFLVRLYNVLSFFNIYANIDGFVPIASPEYGHRPTAQRSELDRWIISELHRTIRDVRANMDAFENFPGARRLNDFVDALSNWYVRRSRPRFWRSVENAACKVQNAEDEPGARNASGGEAHTAIRIHHSEFSPADQDKWDAYHTLYGCLWTLSQLIAPFTPFFAETMYQNLTGIRDQGSGIGGTEAEVGDHDSRTDGQARRRDTIPDPRSPIPVSVHLCDYPVADESLIDEKLVAEMDLVRDIVSLGRAARTAAKLKVRQPLSRVEIILARREHAEWLEAHQALIAEELNIEAVEFTTEADHYVSYQVKPDFKALGPKFGKLAPKIAAALGTLDAARSRRTLAEGGALTLEVDGRDLTLTSAEVQVRLEARPGWSAAQGRAGVVVVSTDLTPELIDEGRIRELIHHVQAERKEQNLPYEARITFHVQTTPEFAAVVQRHAATIQSECLAAQIVFGPPPDGSRSIQVKVDDYAVELAIVPA
jgi:isoleucyl-tRNA synthetase